MSDLNAAALAELHEVKGTLKAMTLMLHQHHESTHTMLRQQHESTNQRIDDLRTSMDGKHAASDKRIDGVGSRVGTLEQNERATAIRTAGLSAITGAIVGGLVQFIKLKG